MHRFEALRAFTAPHGLFCLWALLIAAPPPALAQRFFPDDPVSADRDDLAIPKPQVVELSNVYDVIEHTFAHRPGERVPPAANVNTLGEVPDSSWLTNRIGVRPMSIAELVLGPNREEGPDLSRPWRVIAAKTQGITPGFRIRDSRGEVFFIKVDPKGYPHLLTAAEVVGSKFFHAFGYNVAENYLARVRPEDIAVAEDATVSEAGKRRRMTLADLALILEKSPREPDGTIRVVASRRLPGENLGPFKYHGTRGDDPNDVFAHEHRRELRGLRVFSAWLNHDDARSLNSVGIYVGEPGRGHVRHYLIDFGSTLGSSSVRPQRRNEGNEYHLELAPFAKSAFTFGVWDRAWRHVKYRDYPEVGRFEAEFFRPERWKTLYPNPAFERMQPADALWATRIVMQFSDDAVRALVHAGQFSDPAAEGHLADTLIRRRNKIVAHYLTRLNPLTDFRTEGSGEATRLAFRNLGEEAKLAVAEAYEYRWFVFDNATGGLTPLGDAGETARPSLPVPQHAGDYLEVRISTRCSGQPLWKKSVDVFLRGSSARSVVGIEREN